jgi:ABC-type nitrate/sulfonate/bicarbonate transport system substrate-binding protein
MTETDNGIEKPQLTLGFIPLTDCAPLVIAQEQGYFAKYGLDVQLSKETSWANIRDKLAIGVLDGAQMLAPMPIAMSLGVGPIQQPMCTALSLDLNGNAITVSNDLYAKLCALDAQTMQTAPVKADALKQLIEQERRAGRKRLTFAMVFPISTHNYELRYWMAAAGIDPDRDVELVVVPPPQMPERLRAGDIDGYCVGEPWNEVAVREGIGRVLITSYEIWQNNPEKVFGVSQEWAVQHPNTHRALITALLEAARWLDEPEHRREVVEIIARSRYINAPQDIVRMSMTGTFQYAQREFPRQLPDFNVFHRYAANFPWRSHAMWLITQMLRWGQLESAVNIRDMAENVYRPDIYRAAATRLGIPVPQVDYKVEGMHNAPWHLQQASGDLLLGPDAFFDGQIFSPADPLGYLQTYQIHNCSVEMSALAACNPSWNEDAGTGRLLAQATLPGSQSNPRQEKH